MNLQRGTYGSPTEPERSTLVRWEPREQLPRIPVLLVSGQLLTAGTSAASPMDVWPESFEYDWRRTAVVDCSWDVATYTGGVAAISSDDTSRAISELRRISALTWEQVGQLFGVSRRSVHFWASGKQMNVAHEQRLFEILDIVRQADRGEARRNRAALLSVTDGEAAVDLLAAGEFAEARARLGRGEARGRVEPEELDADARAERTPPPPDSLIEAMNDRIHRDAGRGGAARTVRNMRRESAG